MFSSGIIVLSILGLFAGFHVKTSNALEIRNKRSVLYHGRLAPTNQDGTVAFTPEVQQAKATNQAAFAAEFQRLKEAERLAAAHPDLTSPRLSYNSNNGLHRSNYIEATAQQYYPQVYLQAPLNHDGTVANTADVKTAAAAQKAAFATEYKRLQEAERLAAAHPDFTSPSYVDISYNKGNQNQQKAFQYKSYNYRPQFYIPAPLNKDGTVALTPEVQQARATHQAAFAAEFQRLSAAARLAAAYPDLTSPQKGYMSYNKEYYNQNSAVQHIQYNPQAHVPAQKYNSVAAKPAFTSDFRRQQFTANLVVPHPGLTPHGSYSSGLNQAQYLGVHYNYNPQARTPAPLNPDGTVAHTPEYKAIAAAHQAEYTRALQRNKHHTHFSSGQQSYLNNYHSH